MWGRLAATPGTIYIQSVIIIQPITSLIDRVIIDRLCRLIPLLLLLQQIYVLIRF